MEAMEAETMKFARTIGVIAFAAALTGGAQAADMNSTYSSSTFNWDGFYAGLGISGLSETTTGVTAGYLDGYVGVNFTSGALLFGAESLASIWRSSTGSTGYSFGGEGRLGWLASPEVVLYGSTGFFWENNSTTSVNWLDATLGAGSEFAVSDNISLDLEYKFHLDTTGGGANSNSVSGSALWHFN